jgi:nucleoside 2-deoxyribosyltransferase
MLRIVGGTYREICAESSWDQLFGSGLRAAAIARQQCERVQLTTYVSDAQRPTLDAYAEEYNIEITAELIEQTLSFRYEHGLARPHIDPPLHLLHATPPLNAEGDAVLRFGLLEGDGVVSGNRVVYDPQSSYDPRAFHENGSTAQHLAVIANFSEAQVLARMGLCEDGEQIGQAILRNHAADVVVIKRGALGLLVIEESGTHLLPAVKTSRVFPIGSGDVFSAVFAINWAVKKAGAGSAAEAAAQAVASHCNNPRKALAGEIQLDITFDTVKPSSRVKQRRVYLASPFFTTATRWLMNQAYRALKNQGVTVFSPFHDVGYGKARDVAPADLRGLESCDAVLAVVDGFDAGTLFEVGYARSKGIPVVAFVQNEPAEPLKMLEGTECLIVDDFVTAIYQAVWLAFERE